MPSPPGLAPAHLPPLLSAGAAADDRWIELFEQWAAHRGRRPPDAGALTLLPLLYWRAGSRRADDPHLQAGRDQYLQTLASNARREEHTVRMLAGLQSA